jgi:hypothetical protein
MRVFLGTRMECAQCHDDPFGKTERHDFYELAAFTNGQGMIRRNLMERLYRETEDGEDGQRSPEYRVAQVLWDRVYGMSLAGGGEGRIHLPDDYQYRDAQPGRRPHSGERSGCRRSGPATTAASSLRNG